jgi:PAS domain-containing protein
MQAEEMLAGSERAAQRVEREDRLADGSIREVEVFTNPIEVGGWLVLYSIIHDITERKRAQRDLQQAYANIRTLRGVIPICANCKKIRDDQGYWSQVEVYVREHTEADFSHGICPECMRKLYPEFQDEDAIENWSAQPGRR